MGDTDRAAEALRRSASHAVTAAAVHWHYPYRSRRFLANALRTFVIERNLDESHLHTFQAVYEVNPQALQSLGRFAACRRLNKLRRLVARLKSDLDQAIASDPNPPTLDQIMAGIEPR